MEDWEISGLIRKNKDKVKQIFLSDNNNFFFNYIYNITGADSYFIQKIIDDFFEQCYNNGMFRDINIKYSYATKYIIELRKYIVDNKDIFYENNYKDSDLFYKYSSEIANINKAELPTVKTVRFQPMVNT